MQFSCAGITSLYSVVSLKSVCSYVSGESETTATMIEACCRWYGAEQGSCEDLVFDSISRENNALLVGVNLSYDAVDLGILRYRCMME